MTPPGTFERVYAAIKQRLRDGLYRPGDRLEPAVLSDELNASVTPVRDALHRLTGERLVEAPRQEGFRAPMLTETTLRHLYAWHLDLLLLAISKHHAASFAVRGAEDPATSSLHERRNAIFLELARSTGNPEHVLALQNLIDRMDPIQGIEDHLLDATQGETDSIMEAMHKCDRKALRRELVQYHRRRMRIVPELLARLQNA